MPRPGSRIPHVIALALAGALFALTLLTGCGDDEDADSDVAAAGAPPASAFPKAKGQTLDDLLTTAKPTTEIVALPSGSVFTPGPNRIGFGLFSVDGTQITDGQVALYAAPGRKGAATGPYPAEVESLETDPAFEARTTSGDPDAAKAVYTSSVDLDRSGEWRLVAMIRQGEEMVATRMPSISVSENERIPVVGDTAPPVHTPTVADVGDVSEIDTRDPHDTMHDLDLAEVLGKEPVVLLFATPALCASRVCGPVVDIAEQVKSEVGDDVAFIHMEVFTDNDPSKGVRPQLTAYGLETEPWLFVIDSDGKVVARIEGAFSADELTDALAKAGV